MLKFASIDLFLYTILKDLQLIADFGARRLTAGLLSSNAVKFRAQSISFVISWTRFVACSSGQCNLFLHCRLLEADGDEWSKI